LEGVLSLRPELLRLHRDLYRRLWEERTVPPRLLELCRLRIAKLHDCEAELVARHSSAGVSDADVLALEGWPAANCFSAAERAALTVAEKIPWQPRSVTDEDVAALLVHLSDAEVVALMLALTMFDAHCRLQLAFSAPPAP
jgi:alkylhydroperoxidase family enzyme